MTGGVTAWGLAGNESKGGPAWVAKPLSGPSDGAGAAAGPLRADSGLGAASRTAGATASPSRSVWPLPVAPPIGSGEPALGGSPTGRTSTGPAAVGLTARYSNSSTWDTGFVAVVDVTNGSAGAVQKWEVRIAYPSNVVVGNTWNATRQGTSGTVIFTGGPIAAGQKQSFGFEASKTVASPAAVQNVAPTACTVNGTVCEGF
jgi:hypothetical protein